MLLHQLRFPLVNSILPLARCAPSIIAPRMRLHGRLPYPTPTFQRFARVRPYMARMDMLDQGRAVAADLAAWLLRFGFGYGRRQIWVDLMIRDDDDAHPAATSDKRSAAPTNLPHAAPSYACLNTEYDAHRARARNEEGGAKEGGTRRKEGGGGQYLITRLNKREKPERFVSRTKVTEGSSRPDTLPSTSTLGLRLAALDADTSQSHVKTSSATC